MIRTFIFRHISKYKPYVKPDFDPWEIFGINAEDFPDFEAAKKDIKRINRQLSKEKHPDRLRQKWLQENPEEEGVSEELENEWNADWTNIVRAYKTLTDEVNHFKDLCLYVLVINFNHTRKFFFESANKVLVHR